MKQDFDEKNKTVSAREERKASEPKTDSNRTKEISLGAPDIEDEIQLERREAYVEVETKNSSENSSETKPAKKLFHHTTPPKDSYTKPLNQSSTKKPTTRTYPNSSNA